MSQPFGLWAVLLCMTIYGSAQQNPSREAVGAIVAADPSAVAVQEGLIKLDVVVRNQSGKPVAGLQNKDFTLLENSQPEKLLSFQAFDRVSVQPDPPVEVILVIDTLNLSTNQIPDAKSEAEKFLRRNEGHLSQPVSIFLLSAAGLSSTPQPSNDGNALAEEIARGGVLPLIRETSQFYVGQRAPHGTMTLADAANRNSLRCLGSIILEERRYPGRKLLFWIGPGWPVHTFGQKSSSTPTIQPSHELSRRTQRPEY